MSREGTVDFDTFGFDPTTFVSKHGNRYLVSETELDAELAAAGFEIVFRQTRPDLDPAMGTTSRASRAPTVTSRR